MSTPHPSGVWMCDHPLCKGGDDCPTKHVEDCRKHAIHYATPDEIAAMHVAHKLTPDKLVSVSETHVGVQIVDEATGRRRTGTKSTVRMVPLKDWCPCFKEASK